MVAEQRREMELLVRELRERDQELSDLVTSHQHQLSMWEQDRQLILHLQHKCQCLEGNLVCTYKIMQITFCSHEPVTKGIKNGTKHSKFELRNLTKISQ